MSNRDFARPSDFAKLGWSAFIVIGSIACWVLANIWHPWVAACVIAVVVLGYVIGRITGSSLVQDVSFVFIVLNVITGIVWGLVQLNAANTRTRTVTEIVCKTDFADNLTWGGHDVLITSDGRMILGAGTYDGRFYADGHSAAVGLMANSKGEILAFTVHGGYGMDNWTNGATSTGETGTCG